MDVRVARDGADPRHVVVVPDGPAEIAKDAGEHPQHQDEPELGLVDPAIAPGQPDDAPVVERAADERREDDSDYPAQVCQALEGRMDKGE